jgi:8-oxo-dGTP pyrophosphatase MutT (NUDIX family)
VHWYQPADDENSPSRSLSISQCPREYGCWNVEAQRLGSPEVEDRFVATRSLPQLFTVMRAYPCVLVMLFKGQDSAIDVATPNPEFDAWRWVQPPELSTLAVSFKRRLYLSVLAEFPTIFRD